MSIAELKEEAIKQFAVKVEATQDELVLKSILDFLGGIEVPNERDVNLSRHYNDIKAKYGSVLKKLAD